jgi:hypothetical protein
MSQKILVTASRLHGTFYDLQNRASLGAVEIPCVTFLSSGSSSSIGTVDTAESLSGCLVTVSCSSKNALPGRAAVFYASITCPAKIDATAVDVLPVSGACVVSGTEFKLDSLARLLRVRVVLSSDPRTVLTYTVEPSASAPGCVTISVPVPDGVALGSLVTLRSALAAECDVQLGESPLCMTVGYNHAPAPEGPVMAAAEAGNVPALRAALDANGSTEERNRVSGCGVSWCAA